MSITLLPEDTIYPVSATLRRRMQLKGWIELDKKPLTPEEISAILTERPCDISRFGGEFYLEWNKCCARDYMGIIPGKCPAGTIWCNGAPAGSIIPTSRSSDLESAIVEAVRIRASDGVCALSGGVDSALVAALSGLPCIAVGLPDSHDLNRANTVARELDLPLTIRSISRSEIKDTLPLIISLLVDPSPVDLAIATTLFFVAEAAHDSGYQRILTGQGADEVFGGYSRYLNQTSEELTATFAADFASLARQGYRDQTIAGYHDTWLSMPYLDIRVVCAAADIPPEDRVKDGIRKRPLREVAARYLNKETANYEKKAMQYGTGIWKEIKRLARQNGYHNSVSDYMHTIRRV
jgi:asparagine synthase (glutamine-hydrolysing)